MTDQIAITGVECFGHHGVFAAEKEQGQLFYVDLVLGVDLFRASHSDDLGDTVDYGTLTTRVREAVENDPVDLIETVAQRIADVVLTDSRVEWVRVTLHKPHAPIEGRFADVAVSITRSQP